VASAHGVTAGSAEHDALEQGGALMRRLRPAVRAFWLTAALGFGGMSASWCRPGDGRESGPPTARAGPQGASTARNPKVPMMATCAPAALFEHLAGGELEIEF